MACRHCTRILRKHRLTAVSKLYFVFIVDYVVSMCKLWSIFLEKTEFVAFLYPFSPLDRDHLPKRQFVVSRNYNRANFDTFPEPYDVVKVQTPLYLQETDDITIENWDKEPEHPYQNIYATQSFEWIRVRNGHAFPWGGLYLNDTVYYIDMNYQKAGWGHDKTGIFTEYMCDIVFNFHHMGAAYGHHILDYLPVVTMISPELRRKAYFLVRWCGDFARGGFPLFGIPPEHVIELEPSEMLYAKEVYSVRPLMMQGMYGMMLQRMREVFALKLGLDQTTPWRYILYNRWCSRKILNMDAFVNHANSVFPSLPWDLYKDEDRLNMTKGKEWAEKLYFYNEQMFSFGLHGSGHLNCIFMQSNTVIFIVETKESWGSIFMGIAKLFKRHLFVVRDKTFSHWRSGHAIPIEKFKVFDLFDKAVTKCVALEKGWKRFKMEVTHNVPLLRIDGTLATGY